MRLIKPQIINACLTYVNGFCQAYDIDQTHLTDATYIHSRVPAEHLNQWSDAIDFYITAATAQRAQTFLFNSAQIMTFLQNIDRTMPPGAYPPPFDEIIIQFTEPIAEQEFLTGIRTSGAPVEHGDNIAGLVLGFPTEERKNITFSAWFTSTSANRAVMEMDGNGLLSTTTLIHAMSPDAARDKQRILNLGMLCIAYINSPSIATQHITTDPAVNRRRRANGKRELPDYYICQVRPASEITVSEPDEPTSRQVSFMFPVRGHFRRYADGRTVWIRPHHRGLEHGPESQKPKTYKID